MFFRLNIVRATPTGGHKVAGLGVQYLSLRSLVRPGRDCPVAAPKESLSPDSRVSGIMENGTVRIGSIVIDVDNFDRMMSFWQAALRYVPGRPPTPEDPFVILKDPEGNGPSVSIDGMPPERGRLHLDLYTDDQEGEVERLLGLGATRYRPREPGEDFVVLEDPEGNLFCVVDTKGS